MNQAFSHCPGGRLRIPAEFILPSQAADRADESGHPAAVVHAAEPFVLFAVNRFVRTVRIGGIRPVIKGIADIFIDLRFFSEQAFFLSKGDDGCVQRTAMHHVKEKRRERERDEPKPPKCHYPIQAGTFCRDNREMEQCPDFFAGPFPAAFPAIRRYGAAERDSGKSVRPFPGLRVSASGQMHAAGNAKDLRSNEAGFLGGEKDV